MSNENKRQLIIFSVTIIVLLSFIIGRAIFVNRKYPKVKQININAGESYEYDGIEYKVSNFRIESLSEFVSSKGKDELNEMESDYFNSFTNGRILLVDFTVCNKTSEIIDNRAYYLPLSSNTWSNCSDYSFIRILNAEEDIKSQLNPYEEMKITLPFIMTEAQFANNRIKAIKDTRLWLTICTYPNYIRLYVN